MRKTLNRERVEGKLYDHNLAEKVTGPTSKNPGTPYIGGSIDVATDDAGVNIVTVYYTYVTPTTKTGTINKTYTVLKQIIDSGKTVLNNGADATLVRCDTALGVNDFFSERAKTDANPDGLVSAKRNEGGFVSIISKLGEESTRNTFECDMLMNGGRLVEADEERNIPNDYYVIKGCVFNFRNDMIPVEFVVKSAAGIQYFESLDLNSNVVFKKVKGKITSQTIVDKREEESAFGEASVREYERTVRQWVVDFASPESYDIGDAETGITADEIKEIKQKRDTHIAEVKANAEAYAASQNGGGVTAAAPANPGAGFNF